MSIAFDADRPINDHAGDKLNRKAFARRVAETIRTQAGGDGLVIGIYGEWGCGKTSVLNLIEKNLSDDEKVIVLSFNPWIVGSESALLTILFTELAGAIGKALPKLRHKAGKVLVRLGTALSLASIPLEIFSAGVVRPNLGKSFKEFGKVLNKSSLEDLKQRAQDLIDESKRHIVVLVDDVDRMDAAEIGALFKMVRLTADFRHVTYLLAFDEKMVASALASLYGGGSSSEAGFVAIEKIVQVPLHLPAADSVDLLRIALKGVQDTLAGADVQLDPAVASRFNSTFQSCFGSVLKIPRQARR